MPDPIIPITRPNIGSAVPPVQKIGESKFPTETIDLPTAGYFYNSESPLASGKVELKQMTAREEDILTSKAFIQKNIVLDKLLDALLVDKSIKSEEILVCDRNAIFFAIRKLAYGDDYHSKITCSRCGKENDVLINLKSVSNKPFDFSNCKKGENTFTYKLPNSGTLLTYKLLAKKDETAINQEIEGLSKVTKELSKDITTRLFYIITSVDGNSDRARIRKFINEEFSSKDSLAFRKNMRDQTPDINNVFDFTCEKCGVERVEEIPMGVSFFWPSD